MLLGATLPQAGEQAVPPWVSTQETPPLLGSLPTVAVNCWAIPAGSKALPGETETVTAGTLKLTEAEADGLVTEAAVRVTLRSLGGGVVGAL